MIFACSDDAEQKTANEIFTSVFHAVDSATDDATASCTGSGSSGSRYSVSPDGPSYETSGNDINYANADGSIRVTGTYTATQSEYDFDLTITFTNYTSPEGVTINGSASDHYIYQLEPLYMTADLTGSFLVAYEGKTYNFSWDIDFTFNGQNYTLNGGFWLDGQYYPAEFAE